jgi:transposase InsO family protein
LDKDICNTIPKSTLYSWKNRDFSKFIGCETSFSNEQIELIKKILSHQILLKAAKGLYFIFSIWISIAENIRGMKSALRKNKDIIVQTIDYVIPLIGLKHACKLFKISQNQFYAWKRKVNCMLSPLEICTKQNPFNIAPTELLTIKEFIEKEEYKTHPLVSVYYEMMRKGKAFMSLTSFYRYANRFDVANRKIFKAKPKTGIRAKKPKEIIHADVCVYRPLDYTKLFIYFIVDNFSRKILGWKISTEYKSSIMLENLKNVYSHFSLERENPLTQLIVDDGIENKGFVNIAIENQEIKITKLIAQKDIHFSNSMVEAINKRMKYDFLFRTQLLDFEHTKNFLETAVEQYNHRPHSSLFGLTPHEVFYGAKPHKDLFKEQKTQAKARRIAENKALSCGNCAFLIEKQG